MPEPTSPTPRCPTCGNPLSEFHVSGNPDHHYAMVSNRYCTNCERPVARDEVLRLPTEPVPSLSRFFAGIFKKK